MKPYDTLKGAAMAAAILAAATVGYIYWSESRAMGHERTQSSAERAAARIADGARLESRHEVAPGETVSVLAVPSSLGGTFDTRCLLYVNSQIGSTALACPESLEFSALTASE